MASTAARLANTVPLLILRSPVHRLMSGRYAIIEFTGCNSGRRYATPIAYIRDGDRILLSTDSPWWRNLKGGAPVRLRLRGRTVSGTATPMLEPDASHAAVQRLVDTIPSYARTAGLARDRGRVNDSEIARDVNDGRVAIEVTLTTGA